MNVIAIGTVALILILLLASRQLNIKNRSKGSTKEKDQGPHET